VMTRSVMGLLVVSTLALFGADTALADTHRQGILTFLSDRALVVDGVHVRIEPSSVFMSGPRAISPASLAPGVRVAVEIDERGALIQLRVDQVVE
jgi:hypothetical protein